ncbi:hypothetical protein HOP50_07g47150 [Chloropicon primus]|uniref:Uncharacterized protein n=1 Tax=Chloropicon primus TaxID=1764295 RepID=A0A5B8MNT2_9CHLO|nr:hypothetical protein A3770_07p46940 [Chloropicon primus]UPR01393.1 hypothetical protein HOP50_07g47150 [Chloropicon primus]|mmetsp:Transcript_4156/g.12110  ORF Transcript_4156/g.12110 Transcript_4156/m.12110 type:complete len:131 (+) Transcript_4156:501-893(+)|eukprot:QDZ22176.1 hypothetical protein A3770_07p46940 [Chloropicon primus]
MLRSSRSSRCLATEEVEGEWHVVRGYGSSSSSSSSGRKGRGSRSLSKNLSIQLITLAAVNRSINSQQDNLERMRERITSSSSPPPSSVVCDLATSDLSLDPLQVFQCFDDAIVNIDAQVKKFHQAFYLFE